MLLGNVIYVSFCKINLSVDTPRKSFLKEKLHFNV